VSSLEIMRLLTGTAVSRDPFIAPLRIPGKRCTNVRDCAQDEGACKFVWYSTE